MQVKSVRKQRWEDRTEGDKEKRVISPCKRCEDKKKRNLITKWSIHNDLKYKKIRYGFDRMSSSL